MLRGILAHWPTAPSPEHLGGSAACAIKSNANVGITAAAWLMLWLATNQLD